MDKGKLAEAVSAIEKAFADVPYPGDENIALHQNFDPSDGFTCAEVLKGKDWRKVEPIMLFQCQTPGILTPAAFRYYLPAFMLARMLHANIVDVAGDNMLCTLVPNPELSPSFHKRVDELSFAQKTAVRLFFEAVASDPDDWVEEAQKGLARYWGQWN